VGISDDHNILWPGWRQAIRGRLAIKDDGKISIILLLPFWPSREKCSREHTPVPCAPSWPNSDRQGEGAGKAWSRGRRGQVQKTERGLVSKCFAKEGAHFDGLRFLSVSENSGALSQILLDIARFYGMGLPMKQENIPPGAHHRATSPPNKPPPHGAAPVDYGRLSPIDPNPTSTPPVESRVCARLRDAGGGQETGEHLRRPASRIRRSHYRTSQYEPRITPIWLD